MKKQPEYALQTQVCNYLRIKYKEVLFMSDTVASIKLTQAQAIRNKAILKIQLGPLFTTHKTIRLSNC